MDCAPDNHWWSKYVALVILGCLSLILIAVLAVRADQRITGIVLALTCLAGAVAIFQMSLQLSRLWRWVFRAVVVALTLYALIWVLYVNANWPLYAGRAASDAGDLDNARIQYEVALQRMGEPGVLTPSDRYKLTKHGVVFMGRVTLLIELAGIAREEGRSEDVLPLLRKAQAASASDSEKAGLDSLNTLVETLERQESEQSD